MEGPRPLCPSTDVMDGFFNRGRAVRKSTQASAKPEKALAAAGAQMPRARDHCADFLHCLAVNFFFLWDLNFAAWF